MYEGFYAFPNVFKGVMNTHSFVFIPNDIFFIQPNCYLIVCEFIVNKTLFVCSQVGRRLDKKSLACS